MDVTVKIKSCKLFLSLFMIFSVLAIVSVAGLCPAQGVDLQCSGLMSRWEKATEDLKEKLQNYSAVQSTPVERLVQRPIVSDQPGRTIALQISEAVQTKEDLLKAKRAECRDLINLENQAFTELQECAQSVKSSKNKDFVNLSKKRRTFIDKAVLSIAEVREVEGQETVIPYEAANQDPYSRSVNNYWQNYQQMYRGWWNR